MTEEEDQSITRGRKGLWNMLPDEPRHGHVVKILIGIEIGSRHIRAAWKPCYTSQKQQLLVDRPGQSIRVVHWEFDRPHCPAEVVFRVMQDHDGRGHLQLYWGCEVEAELEERRVGEQDVLRWIGPVLLDHQRHEVVVAEREEFEERLDRLRQQAITKNVAQRECSELTAQRIYASLLGRIFDRVCEDVTVEFPDLGPLLSMRQSAISAGLEVEVGLVVPTRYSPEAMSVVLQTAVREHLPNPFPVPDLAGALLNGVHEQWEGGMRPRPMAEATVLLLETGARTMQAVVCSIIAQRDRGDFDIDREGIFVVRQSRLQRDTISSTEWVGGSQSNQACRRWVETALATAIDEMLSQSHYMQRYGSRDTVIDVILQEFEHEKKSFWVADRQRGISLALDGFPANFLNANPAHRVIIDYGTMEGFFAEQLRLSEVMIRQQMSRFNRSYQGQTDDGRVEQIILTGGANQSSYIKKKIGELEFMNPGDETPIRVRTSSHWDLGASAVKGAVLLLQDKYFDKDWILNLREYYTRGSVESEEET